MAAAVGVGAGVVSSTAIFQTARPGGFPIVISRQKRRNATWAVPTVRSQTHPDYMPDAKFYKVEAVVRPWRAEHVSSGLLKMGIRGVTVSDAKGFGAQGGSTERQDGSEFREDMFVGKTKMEIVISKDQVEAVIEKIIEEARTGEIGDGKIFLTPVSDLIRVRTGERGETAEKMAGGRSEMISALNQSSEPSSEPSSESSSESSFR